MDDNTQRLKVEFPVGDLKVIVEEPTQGQMFVLSMSRRPQNEGEGKKLAERVTRVLEALTGEQWYSVIEDGLISGELQVLQLMDLLGEILKFPWAEHRKAPEPETRLENEVAETVTRPAPRVVGG
jgi:hypothetical protein